MRPNLIQTYMNNMPQVTPDKKDRNLDIEYVLSNRTFIKPLKAKGRLVHNGILGAPAKVYKNFVYDTKSLGKSIAGVANDHELGKVNDIGMKLGGLMIAAYLMTRKQAPLPKAMELVGFASFFAAMSIWPKVALQLPAKLIHGFNIRQKYEDSFGREKMFFQDPQYLPWDLYSDEQIDKIGDWMKVPKNINNRREFIQEKMKKVAVQNNTMWMLTSGFATPILSALMCNALEKPAKRYLGDLRSKKAERLIENVGEVSEKYKDKTVLTRMDSIIAANKNSELTPEVVKQIKDILSTGFDGVTSAAIRDDLDNILHLNDKRYILDSDAIQRITQYTAESLENIVKPEELKSIIPSVNDFADILDKSGYLNKELSEADLKRVLGIVGTKIRKNISLYNNSNAASQIDEVPVINRLFGVKVSNNPVAKALFENSTAKLTPKVAERLKSIARAFTDFKAKNAVLDEYIYLKAAAAPETGVANAWNEVMESLPKLFNISDKEIAETRHDRKMVGKLIREKIEHIVSSDRDDYDNLIKSLVEKISQLDSKIKDLDTSSNSTANYRSAVNSIFEQFAQLLDEKRLNMPNTEKRLNGAFGSLKNIQMSFVTNRLLGIRSSLYRLLNTLDFYKRIADVGAIDRSCIAALHDGMPREMKEEVVELAKNISVEGTTSDFITKFYELRNPNPDMSDLSQIVVKDGKVKNKYLDGFVSGGKVDLPQDKTFFQEVVRLLYENPLHPKTSEVVSSSVFADELQKYRDKFIKEIGDADYFFKPNHTTRSVNKNAKSYQQFLVMGMAPDQMFSVTMKEMFNTKKWLKMFGGFGLGLLGITVLSQFFFGKMKVPKGQEND